jgi:N-acetylmuramoyl-L-alanine amidase
VKAVRALVCVLAMAVAPAWAQTMLAVNGVTVAGATTALVAGVTYAPAVDLAAALGADVVTDAAAGRVTFVLGAAVVQVALVVDAGAALGADPAITRDGAVRPGPAAVHDGIEAFVPVKGVVEAFGGRVAFVEESNTVVAVVPRPTLTVRLEGGGASQRLVFRASGPTEVAHVVHDVTGVLELRFERADGTAVAFDGDAFVRATIEPTRGGVEARVQLAPERTARVVTLPDGQATVVVVAFGAAPSPTTIAAAQGARLVLDAGHGGSDAGLVFGAESEGDLTRAFVDAVAEALVGSGIEVVRTRPSAGPVALSDRAAAGAGADAFVSIHAGALPLGQARAYVLDDASEASAIEMAVRRNAESALESPQTDALRRALLVRLVPDAAAGRRLADALRRGLADVGIAVGAPQGAPLAVLAGAAGRGLLLELSPDDLRDPSLPLTVAAALAEALAAP